MENYSTSKTTLTADDIFLLIDWIIRFSRGRQICYLGLDYKRDFDDPESDKDKFLNLN